MESTFLSMQIYIFICRWTRRKCNKKVNVKRVMISEIRLTCLLSTVFIVTYHQT